MTFADDVKYNTYGSWQGDYHFNEAFWLSDPGDTWIDYRQSPNKNTLNDGIFETMNWLMEVGDYNESFIYRKIMMLFNDEEDIGKSYALRLLLHYLGDHTQPLHNLNMVNSVYPDSDSGGNAIDIVKPTGASQSLHAAWDGVIYLHDDTISRPFDGDGKEPWDDFITYTREVHSRNTISEEEYSPIDIDFWANEARDHAKNVYDGVVVDEVLDETTYRDVWGPFAERQVVLAGYRIAEVMRRIYKTEPSY